MTTSPLTRSHALNAAVLAMAVSQLALQRRAGLRPPGSGSQHCLRSGPDSQTPVRPGLLQSLGRGLPEPRSPVSTEAEAGLPRHGGTPRSTQQGHETGEERFARVLEYFSCFSELPRGRDLQVRMWREGEACSPLGSQVFLGTILQRF